MIYWYESNQFELFNLAHDLGERNDLIDSQREVALKLAANMRRWMIEVDAQRPVRKANGEMLPVPTL